MGGGGVDGGGLGGWMIGWGWVVKLVVVLMMGAGGWCASEGWGGWCEVIVGDGVLVVVCYWNYNVPRSTNKIKFFNQISTYTYLNLSL